MIGVGRQGLIKSSIARLRWSGIGINVSLGIEHMTDSILHILGRPPAVKHGVGLGRVVMLAAPSAGDGWQGQQSGRQVRGRAAKQAQPERALPSAAGLRPNRLPKDRRMDEYPGSSGLSTQSTWRARVSATLSRFISRRQVVKQGDLCSRLRSPSRSRSIPLRRNWLKPAHSSASQRNLKRYEKMREGISSRIRL